MPLDKDIAKSLSYLRRKYKVTERDLVSIAKKLHKAGTKPEETWEEITQRTLRNRQGRFTRVRGNMK